jgi:hypothetical protein
MTTTKRALALNDDQLAVVQRMAAPLNRHDRSKYLERVAQLLDGETIGDGVIHRAAKRAQSEFLTTAAAIDGRTRMVTRPPKWSR